LNGPDGDLFRNDNAVTLATKYWETGIAPPSFVWLHKKAMAALSDNANVADATAADGQASGGKKRSAPSSSLASVSVQVNGPGGKKNKGGATVVSEPPNKKAKKESGGGSNNQSSNHQPQPSHSQTQNGRKVSHLVDSAVLLLGIFWNGLLIRIPSSIVCFAS
jgi:hypothetical protein